MQSVTLFSDDFVTALIIYLLQRTEWKILLFKWVWIWEYGRIHKILLMNILDRWVIRVPRQFWDVAKTIKVTLDVMDENILKCSWPKNSLAFRLATELSNMPILYLWTSFLYLGCTCIKQTYHQTGSFRISQYFYWVQCMIPFTSF